MLLVWRAERRWGCRSDYWRLGVAMGFLKGWIVGRS
jgi:hypothetical protein